MNSSVRLSAALRPQLDFWRRQLTGLPAPIELPADRLRASGPLLRRAQEVLDLPEELLYALEQSGHRHGADLPQTLLAGFLALLHRYTGREDLVIGTPLGDDEEAGLLPLRVNTGGDPSFAELLGRVGEAVRSAREHQDLSLEELLEELEVELEPDPSRHPLFQVAFVPNANLDGAGLDLQLRLMRRGGRVALAAGYASDLFEAATVNRLLGHLLNLLEGIAAGDGARLSELPLLGSEERDQVLVAWNGADAGLPEAPVHEIVLQHALARPEALAVSWDGGSLTYGELLGRSLRLASWLRRRGLGSEDLVALRLERSPDLVVSSLGVLLSGAAYLPTDPSNPPERLAYVLRDSGASLLLTMEGLRLPGLPLEQVALEPLGLEGEPGNPPLPERDPDRLAYVIYTSGSTGTPKGTDLVHRGLSNTIAHFARKYVSDTGERMAVLASPGFDASVWEIWLALTAGASIHVAPAEILASAPDLLAWYAREGVTYSFAAPVQVEAMLAEFMPEGLALRTVMAGGDRLRLRPRPDCPFAVVNNYGPTEASIVTTEGLVAAEGDRPPTIGRPLDNVRVYLLDAALQPVPAGVPGELFIGGEGVARGYRGRPDLTAERFVPDPFGPPGARLYQSGDLARWLPSGEVDFIGRADHQVKLRGFRIELGEIESVLLGHPGVRGAAVLLRAAEGRLADLAGYVALASNGAAPSIPELREHLASRLPDYMVPSAWAVLEALPLNASGKVDRRALERVPAAAVADEGSGGDTAPRTQLEELLADLFSDVLDVPDGVGIHQDFFQLGGHSLLATRLASRVRELCGVELGLRSMFEHPTVTSLASWIEHQQGRGDFQGEASIPLTPAPAGPAPLSSAQQRLWFLERLRPGTALYNLAQLFDLRGELTVPALAAAFDAVVRRHEALRTLFAPGPEGTDPVQLVCREPLQREPLPVVDLCGLPGPVRQAEAERITFEEARRPYDLERGPLMRTALLRLGPEEHRLLVGSHHIVSDAWSVGVLLRELSALYQAALALHASPLPPLPVQYPGFAVWQHRRLTEEAAEVQLAWWREHLAGVPPVLELQADRLRPAVPSLQGDRLRLPFGANLEPALAALGRRQGATLFMTLLAAFQALLHRYTLQEDFVVGSPVAGRDRLELEALIGFFVNMLPLRASASEAKPFSRLLAGVRESVLAGFAHQDLPFDRLVEELAPQRDLSRTPLFQVAFALQEVMAGPDFGVDVTAAAEVNTGVSKFDLSLLMERGPRGLEAIAEYSSDLFERETVQRMLGAFRVLVAGALADPNAPLGELPLLAAEERDQVVCGWNRTGAEIPEMPVHRQFELQAAAHPGALAVVSPEEALTYGELNRRANLLAWRLRRLGVGPEDVVALLLERSTDLPLATLATLKAGGAYLPIDPAYPAERVLYVLRDAGTQALLTTSRIVAGLPEVPLHTGRMILLDEARAGVEESPDEGKAPPPADVDPDGLAYVIYTSGSTGAPKGTELHHRGLSNLVGWHSRTYDLVPADRSSLVAGPGFDASVWETWPPLVMGASAHVPPSDVLLSPPTLLFWLAERGVTVAFLPTPLAEGVLAEPMPADLALRLLTTGGDRLVQRPAADLRFPLVNHYGPTESTVITTAAVVAAEGHRTPHIGGPIANLRVHLLDRGFAPLPVGVPGELCVAGVGLARGYRRRPDLTAERFVPDPLGGPGDRLYRTGDLARRLPGGELEFLGRLDHQVKIRGYRIELGEIETALRRHPGVREAVAMVRQADGRLVGCVVLHEAGELSEAGAVEALRASLAGSLPEVMIPTAWVFLEALPFTPNGKVDRRALARIAPAPETHAAAAPPRTAAEAAVAEVWERLLGVEGIGAFDDFFALGGHSLLAARLAARIHERLGVELPLRVIFQEPTVARLAAWIEAERHRGDVTTGPSLVAGVAAAPLSFAQQRLWFLDRLEPGSAAYNLPALMRLSGPLRPELLALALAEVVRRHAALRTTFEVPEGAADPVQVVHPLAGWNLPVLDLAALPEGEREAKASRRAAEEARRPFDLQRGPLLRTTLLRLNEGEHRLLATMHHIVSDGWSLEVLQRELGILYQAFAAGRPSPLPKLPAQYPDYAVWQRGWLNGDELERQISYWRERLASPPAFDLPADRPRPAVWTYHGTFEEAELPESLAAGVERVGQSRHATPFMTLLAGFLALLYRYTGQEDLLIGTPVAGRGRADVEPLIGFFVNTLALRIDLSGEPAFLDLIARVRESALAAYAHQDLPFEKLVAEVAPERDLSRNPLFQVIFAFLDGWEPVAIGPDLTLGAAEAVHPGTAKFDLSFHASRAASGLHLWLEYATDLFDRATIARLIGHFRLLLEEAVARPEAPIAALPLLTASERAQLAAWGQEAHRGHPVGLLHGLFEDQARRTPEAVALVADGVVLTYAELEERSARLAGRLRALGAGPEVAVAICLERKAELIVSLLAVLRSGSFYVPLDPRYPAERLGFLIEDSGARIVVTQSRFAAELPPSATQLLLDGPATATGLSETGPGVLPENLAYLIYTSGSTGRPKAVAITHASAVKLAWWAREAFSPEELRGVLACTAVTFDLSVYEIFVTLAWGGAVILVDDALSLLSGPPDLPAGLEMTLINTVPSAIAELLREEALPASVRTVNLAGDALPRTLSDRVYARPGTERLYNLYGPSEDTTYSTWTLVERSAQRQPSIGRPVHDTRACVVDRRLERLPLGVPGELCLAGDGLARGYLGRPELTADRFVPDPWGEQPGGRMYRTGDLTRLRSDGELEYLGRMDHQVKVRGYRIELGEVESALAGLPGIEGAAVLLREDSPGDRRLVAYLAGEAQSRDLRLALLQTLPEPMVPSAFVLLPALPLTAHGKVDRRALSRIAPAAEARAASEPPSTPAEVAVAQMWSVLLGVEGIGAQDDFFALGGHSLLAARLTAQVQERLGVELPLRVVFQEPTVARLAGWIEAARRQGASTGPSLVAGLAGEVAPLSFAQQRLWFFEQLQPGSPAYNIPIPFRFAGLLRPELLAAALTEVVRRHAALRTTFEVPEGTSEPVQVVHPAAAWHLPVIDLGGLPPELREAEAGRLAAEDARLPFDLRRFPLMRTTLIRLGASEHRLLATLHHIISDGWSMELLEREMGALYGALAAGLPSPLPELPVQYGDYAVWQRSWLAGHELERQLAFWRSRLAEPPALELPTDRPRPAIWSQRGGVEMASLPGELTDRLEQVGRSHGATTFLTFFAVFLALLQRYTSQEDLVVGTPLAGRGRPEVQDLIGFFVNTLALRVSLDGDPSFETLLGRVRETVLEAYDHQDVPFEKLVAELAPTPDLSRNPLFQVVFGVQERLEQVRIGDDLVLSAGEWVHHGTAKFDLTLHAYRTERELQLWAEYSTALFDAATIQRLLGHFRRLLEGIAAEGAEGKDRVRLSELALLDEAEREQVLVAWNRTRQEIPEEPVHRLFFRWAEATPDALAVSWEGGSLTYAALGRRAAELAGRLRSQGVGPETVVALRLERSAELVIAALAVLEAGGAYLPIDPAHPLERAEWILRDSGAALLLTREDLKGPSLTLPRFAGEGGIPLLPHALAYVIYTSGSTGTPKGTELRHHGLSSIIAWHRRAYGMGPADRCPLLAGPGFDASVWDTWAALTAGASLHVPPREVVLSPPALFAWFEEKGITVSFLATPLAEAFLAEEEARSSRLALRNLLTGGDRLRRRPRPGLPFALINHYGPTESTIVATAGRVALAGERSPDIGVPLDNTRLYILDRWLQPVPVGVPGEICLAGEGLARCYRNQPELTARAFVPDPFDDGQRLYRTGDLARWLPSGVIEFLGRADHQVKIRGQRIELGEIEATLGRHPAVCDSVVMVRDERLAAWVVTREAVTVEALRAWLARSLTEAMIPVAWAFLDALPLTPNGKVDRRALPAQVASQDEETFVPPATATQRALARIWGSLLGLERVGARDNFFQLGGHSLSATQLVTRVHERFGITLELRTVFENPVLEELAAHVDSVRGSSQGHVEREGMYPLSFGQQRLWFLDRLQPGSAAYNIPALLRFTGPLRPEILAAALARVVSRHAALRTTFEMSEFAGDPVQVVHLPAPWSLPLIDLAGLPADERNTELKAEAGRLTQEEARRPFDLQRGPMLRTALLRLDAEEHRLLATMHHAVADGWSLDLLLREIGILYGACIEGRPSPLPELPMQYPDFAVWQRSWLTGDELGRQLGWWRERLARPPAFELPLDRPRPPVWSFGGDFVRMELPETMAGRLERFGQSHRATPFMTLLAGFLVLLYRHTGQEDLLVGTPVAGRSRVDIEELIGFFVNMLPLRVGLEGEPAFLDVLGRVRESALAAYAYQEIPFEKLVAEVAPERDLSRNPLFQVLFAFLDGGERTPIAPGLTMTLEEPVHSGTSKLDLSFHVTRAAGRLHIWAEYATALFDRATVLRLSEHFGRLMEEALAHPEMPVSRLPLLGAAERAQLFAWDEADRRTPRAPAAPPPAVEFVAPRTALEEEVAQVWSEVLGVERVGLNDSFWDLGGHSLLAVRALARLEASHQVTLPLQSVFTSPTLAGFSSVLAERVLASEGEAEMDEALAALGDMSEEEVRALIEQTVRELEELA